MGVREASDLPVWLQSYDFKPTEYYRTAYHPRERLPVQQENFDRDEPESDQEFEVYDDNDRVRSQSYPLMHIGDDMERFYKEILDWIVHPTDNDEFGHINSTETANAGWLRWYFQEYKSSILGNVTHARDTAEYAAHMKSFLTLTLRGTIRQALRRS